MKKVLILTIMIMVFGCGPSKEELSKTSIHKDTTSVYGRNLYGYGYKVETIVIDNCEYLVGTVQDTHAGISILHKTNCKNPIHKQ